MNEDILNFVFNTYEDEIWDVFGTKELSVSFSLNSHELVDDFKPIKKNILTYNDYRVQILQDYTITNEIKEIVTDFGICKLDGMSFIKIVSPFTKPRAYDFVIAKSDEMETILRTLKDRDTKRNFKYDNNLPIIGHDFLNDIEEETIKFLMNEDFRNYCRNHHIKLKRGIVLGGEPGTGKCSFYDVKVKVRFKSKDIFDGLQKNQKNM